MKRLQEILEDIGLNRREARVYLAVLQHPEASLADVTRITLTPRMSCYTILRALLQKGFIDTLVKKKHRYFIAVPSVKIFERLARRADEFKEAVPRFERHSRVGQAVPRVRFFEGIDGIRAVFRRILDEKRPFSAITCIEDIEQVAKTYFKEFIRQRIKQNLKVWLLTNRTPASLRLKQKDGQELRETRFVPEKYRFHTAEYILQESVATLSLKQDPPTALLIEDQEIARTHTMYFELLWNQALVR